jgi:ABC-type multidrug transport system ATPase subunit
MERGRLIALDTPRGLVTSHGGGIRAVFSSDAADLGFLGEVRGVSEVRRTGSQVEVAGDGRHVALVAAALVSRGIVPDDFHVTQPSLEDVFLRITERTTEE